MLEGCKGNVMLHRREEFGAVASLKYKPLELAGMPLLSSNSSRSTLLTTTLEDANVRLECHSQEHDRIDVSPCISCA